MIKTTTTRQSLLAPIFPLTVQLPTPLHQPLDLRVVLPHAGGDLRGAPHAAYTRGALRTAQRQPPALVAVEDDLPVVGDLPDVGAVVVQAHVANQQDLAVVQVSGEAAVLLLAGGGQPGPVAIHTSGLLLPPQLEPILTRSVTDGDPDTD